ncbi:MAG: hypothetical protein JO257_00230 [Deltaproteobacteria bacterium]|nr:hypothetical protein [Deltaproteobacteria bacterium]
MRILPWIVILVGLGLAAPCLTADFTADDHLHRVVERADPGIAGLRSRPMDLFVFADGDPRTNAALRDEGLFPWWTDPQLKLAFWRPITSATHAIDHLLWPDNAAAQLAHNLVWLAIALVLVWGFYRRFLAVRWIAVLALALYALDDARGPVVGWIANRNALVALACALPALAAHDRWRREGWRPGRVLGPLVFAIALGAGESSLAILAYIAAHALWLDRAPWRDRLVALAPYGVLLVAWRIAYGHMGYGVGGSGIYLDPGADPVAFVGAAVPRVAYLLQGQLALPWSDFASFYPVVGFATVMMLITIATLTLITLACARLLHRDATARFFATGMVLAAVPVATTFPADRLLSFIGLGAMGLVAQFLAAAARDRAMLGDGAARRIFGTAIAVLLLVIHGVLAPPLLVARSRSMVAVARVIDRAEAGIPRDPSIADKTVVILAAPSDALAGYVPIMRASRNQPRPAHLYWLATATAAITITRVDDHTLHVSTKDGLLRYEVDQMMRSPRLRPFAVGDRIAMTGVTIEVTAVTPDRRPREITAFFDRALDDPSLVWLRWQGHTYVPTAAPRGTITEPAVDFLKLLD